MMQLLMMWNMIILGLFFVIGAFADTPANCSFEQIEGKWTFYLGQVRGFVAICLHIDLVPC